MSTRLQLRPSAPSPSTAARLLRAGILTAVVDGLYACVLAWIYGSTVTRLWQGVAGTVVGPAALQGGIPMALLGVVMHVGVALGWSAVFLFLVMRLRWVRRLLASRFGVVKVAALYGPFIWMTMSLVVIPVLAGRPPAIGFRWWVQVVGHIPFVGIPLVASLAASAGSEFDAPPGGGKA